MSDSQTLIAAIAALSGAIVFLWLRYEKRLNTIVKRYEQQIDDLVKRVRSLEESRSQEMKALAMECMDISRNATSAMNNLATEHSDLTSAVRTLTKAMRDHG